MNRTRVKICGITNLDDAMFAVSAGADALGFVFYEPSPRYVSPADAAAIIKQLPPFVTSVGLFVDATKNTVDDCINRAKLNLLQFHGDESADFCSSFNRSYIKAIRVKSEQDISEGLNCYAEGSGLLLDSYVKGVPGGTGVAFDWSVIPMASRAKIILAGGLTDGNVNDAIKTINPYAVDVSGGVEASKGIKDPILISKFMKEVCRV